MKLNINGQQQSNANFSNQLYHYQQGNEAKVVQQDLRKIVLDTSIHPYNAIGKVVCRFINNKINKQLPPQYGTASIISNRLIMTAAHVIYRSQPVNSLADQIYFYPEPFHGQKTIRVEGLYFNQLYFSKICPDNSKYDFAFLVLEQNDLISDKQTLNLNFNYSFSKFKDSIINVCGYPEQVRQIKNKQKQYYQERKASRQQGDFLLYKHTTSDGNSGGPVLLKLSQHQYEIIGIHKASKGGHNYCLLLSCMQYSKQILSKMIEKYKLKNKFQQIYIQSPQSQIQQLISKLKISQNQNKFLKSKNQTLKDQNKQIKIKSMQSFQSPKQKNSGISSAEQNQNKIFSYFSKIYANETDFKKRYYKITEETLDIKSWKSIDKIEFSKNSYALKFQDEKVNMEELVKNINWNHIEYVYLFNCKIDDSEWRLLVNNSHLFSGLKVLYLWKNKIKTIKEGDLNRFKSLRWVNLEKNSLDQASKTIAQSFKQKNPNIKVLV